MGPGKLAILNIARIVVATGARTRHECAFLPRHRFEQCHADCLPFGGFTVRTRFTRRTNELRFPLISRDFVHLASTLFLRHLDDFLQCFLCISKFLLRLLYNLLQLGLSPGKNDLGFPN